MSTPHDHAHPSIPNRPMSRRTLLGALAASSVAVSAATLLGSGTFGAGSAEAATAQRGARLVPTNRIGIQLFSIRDKVSSVGFQRVFEELSDIGYSEVEFAGYTQGGVGAITPQQIRQLLDDNGLRATGSHITPTLANIDQQLEIANILGTPHLGQGGQVTNVNTRAGWTAIADTWNQMGAKAKAAGVKLYAHNHAGEFAPLDDDPTTRRYDLFRQLTDPSSVFFELDIYWAYVGQHLYPGFQPLDYVQSDPRRTPLFHLKDGKANGASANGYDIIEFGAGDLPYQAFLSQLRARGQHYGMWEQDNASSTAAGGNPIDSFGNARRSYGAIAALRG